MKRLEKLKTYAIILFLVLSSSPDVTAGVYDSDSSKVSKAVSDTSKMIKDSTAVVEKKIFFPNRYANYAENNSFILPYSEIVYSDYRSTKGLLSLLPFSFFQDMGSYGQPGEIQLYGLGIGSIAYSNRGIGLNNRWKNSFNAYYINSESIDTLESLPITSGFLYNGLNNPVHINIIARNKITKQAYSRLHFHQAPEEEGSIDLIFNTPLFKDTYLFVQVSNSSAEPRGGASNSRSQSDYNTDFSLWNVESSISYLFNDSWVLEASYHHLKDSTEYNGGVEKAAGMYETRNASVIYQELFQRTTAHNFALKLNADLFTGAKTYLSTYYQNNLQEFRQNTDTLNVRSTYPIINNDNKYQSIGINVRQVFKYKLVNFDLFGNYERTEYDSDLFGTGLSEDILSVGGRLSLNLFETFYPSFFAKTSNIRKVQYSGLGAESKLVLTNNFSLFGGLSFFESPYSMLEKELMLEGINATKQKNTTFELKAAYNTENISATLGYFYIKNDAAALPIINVYSDSLIINEVNYFVPVEIERSGFNINLKLYYWKFLFSTNSSYYVSNSSNKNNSLPDFTSYSGIYYVDTLFHSNLYLKAGLNIKLTGQKSFVSYDHEKSLLSAYNARTESTSLSTISSETIPFSNQLDLFVAGTIQEKATVYIVFENLLDEDYYILPYYPMFPQGLRFGISWEFLD